MKILVDMNLSPSWVEFLNSRGYETYHWSTIGDFGASDRVILEWAKENGCVVFTHDLDFGALLAAGKGKGPSVIQARTQRVLPEAIGDMVVKIIEDYRNELEEGALLIIDRVRSRIRILPLAS